ncbi:hypothetical protein [Portibacter marinus]|uniref:hypothetical protein n=1 Tax=Portibacter marinus TaxID=2898660 RepID=UPI001F2059BC|nr:hypothetical protein [Portibacter marinus]
MKKLLVIVFFLAFALGMNAQRANGDVGIGIQAGSPSGLSLQFYKAAGPSYDFIAAWDLDDFFYVNGHALFQPHIGNSERLHFIYGPGVFVGLRDRGNDLDDEVDIGISGTAGLSLIIEKFEVYGRITPRLNLLQSTSVDIGGGVGIRYYF